MSAENFLEKTTTKVDPLYPTGAGNNQDEYMLVEYHGIMHSEVEEVLYGMVDCPILDHFPFKRYREMMKESALTPDVLYRETAFYRPHDLLTYLNDDVELPEDAEKFALRYAKVHYTFMPSTLLSFAAAMRQLITEKYLKQVTFVFDNPDVAKDIHYLTDILGKKNLEAKGRMLIFDPKKHPDIPDLQTLMAAEIIRAKEDKKPYTTIVTNDVNFVEDSLLSCEMVDLETAFFLLRNHSENMIKHDDGTYEEIGTDRIVNIINPNADRENEYGLHLPLRAKFARFSPLAF